MSDANVVAVSGAGGRMGRLISETVSAADHLHLAGLFDPGQAGESVAGGEISDDPEVVRNAGVVVEMTHPGVVMDNLERWCSYGCHVVVGTSGFDDERIREVERLWERGTSNCLIVPNFSIGAVLMMRFAELASRHFTAAEIIELHHDGKADAPSGTAVATAARMDGDWQRKIDSRELIEGALGGTSSGTRVHSVRLPGLLAHQEVLLGNPGELLTIRHDSTDRVSFMPGVLAAIRAVPDLQGVTVGLDRILGL
jgi:4-hydroxy-tetrahydrodipicolinate reductase